jgi:hypothetical protein
MVFAGFCRKKYIKVCKISKKPGKKVCLFTVYYTRGFGISFDPPLQGCLLILAVIAGRGINKDDRNVSSIRYNTKPYILV